MGPPAAPASRRNFGRQHGGGIEHPPTEVVGEEVERLARAVAARLQRPLERPDEVVLQAGDDRDAAQDFSGSPAQGSQRRQRWAAVQIAEASPEVAEIIVVDLGAEQAGDDQQVAQGTGLGQ